MDSPAPPVVPDLLTRIEATEKREPHAMWVARGKELVEALLAGVPNGLTEGAPLPNADNAEDAAVEADEEEADVEEEEEDEPPKGTADPPDDDIMAEATAAVLRVEAVRFGNRFAGRKPPPPCALEVGRPS